MPRSTALDALERFRRNGAWSRQVLISLVKKNGLDARDSALAARLFYGVLQNMALLDFYIDRFTRGKPEPKVRDILRVGAYQILFMDRVPDRAAVNGAVDECRDLDYSRVTGLVNAVLRRISSEKDALPEIPGRGSAKYLSVRYSHPRWMCEELNALRGYKGAEAVLRADNLPAPIYIQTNTLRTTPEELARALGAGFYGESLPGCLLLDGGDFTGTEEFRSGLFYVQDPAARHAVIVADPRPGERVLDVCAAPGGKSFAAAIAMRNEGAVHARDISASKLNLVMDGAERMGLSIIECAAGDAREASGSYDVVIADLPCSGLGVIRKKPDIRYREKVELDRLPELQAELLDAVSRTVRPGGRLVYSTCTWRRRENEDVTDAFLAAHPEFTKTLERTFWPDTDGTDGFYICRMDRKNEI